MCHLLAIRTYVMVELMVRVVAFLFLHFLWMYCIHANHFKFGGIFLLFISNSAITIVILFFRFLSYIPECPQRNVTNSAQ